MLYWCWFFSDNDDDPNFFCVSIWKSMIPWYFIFWLRYVWHVVMFTALCGNYNGISSWWNINTAFKYIIFDKGFYERSNFNVVRVEIFVPIISSETGDQPLPNLLLCSSNFSDEQYLSLFVCGYYHFIVAMLFLLSMNYPSYVLSSNFLGDDLIGYISHPNVLISWMLGFLPYHSKWGDMLYRALCILHLWISADVSAAQHNLFSCWLLSRRPDFTILWMLLLCLSIFPLSQDASPPVVSTDILNSSISKFLTSVEFSS